MLTTLGEGDKAQVPMESTMRICNGNFILTGTVQARRGFIQDFCLRVGRFFKYCVQGRPTEKKPKQNHVSGGGGGWFSHQTLLDKDGCTHHIHIHTLINATC